jgi:hypothetical protein
MRREGAANRRQIRRVPVIRNFFIVAVIFRAALTYQNNYRNFGSPKVEAAR